MEAPIEPTEAPIEPTETPIGTSDPLGDPIDGHILTRAIIDTIREPLIVLDEDLRIIVASKAFYKKFDFTYENTEGKLFYDLHNGSWNIFALRTLLENIIPKNTTVENYEIEHNFPFLGHRKLMVNAREIKYKNGRRKILLSILDVTHQRKLEIEKEKLLHQKDVLLKEMRHRIANSLQLIASVMLLKADTVDSAESKIHLKDAHERIMSIATVQQQLEPNPLGTEVVVSDYLHSLCRSLSRSMIDGRKPITLHVVSSHGSVTNDTAVSFGLIVTELIINSLKHAFPAGRKGEITIEYDISENGWELSVADNGVGRSDGGVGERAGLGTSIVGALAIQLEATTRTETSSSGTKVTISRSTVVKEIKGEA